jgi:hypothetical protein
MWIHLSKINNIRVFVADKKNERHEHGVYALEIPFNSYGENLIPRKCIAPTLWQCCVGIPIAGEYYIYSVNIENPVAADDSVKDKHLTNEHWITEDVVMKHGGITCECIGRIEVLQKDVVQLKVAGTEKILPLVHEDETSMWDINGNIYVLKPGVMEE